MATPPRLPDNTNRTVVIGRTGTGKTVCGLWHLSNYDFNALPWVVFNLKGDEHIESIQRATFLDDLSWVPGKKDRGLFVVSPTPYDLEGNSKERSRFDTMVLKLWERGNVGIFVDEMHPIGTSKPMVLCLTQGRSLRIPMILCTQRPVWITKFAFSEASFIQVFDLNTEDDIDTVESFVPIEWDNENKLKPHESFYYEVAANKLYRFKPCPNMDEVRAVFEEKLPRRLTRI